MIQILDERDFGSIELKAYFNINRKILGNTIIGFSTKIHYGYIKLMSIYLEKCIDESNVYEYISKEVVGAIHNELDNEFKYISYSYNDRMIYILLMEDVTNIISNYALKTANKVEYITSHTKFNHNGFMLPLEMYDKKSIIDKFTDANFSYINAIYVDYEMIEITRNMNIKDNSSVIICLKDISDVFKKI